MLKGHGWLVLRTKQVCFCADEQKNEGVQNKKWGILCCLQRGVLEKVKKYAFFLKKKFGGFNFIRTFAIPNGKMRK